MNRYRTNPSFFLTYSNEYGENKETCYPKRPKYHYSKLTAQYCLRCGIAFILLHKQ